MNLRKCEHCGSMFWGRTEERFCPLCAVAERAREKVTPSPAEVAKRELHAVAG
jgi:hypothetical protein